MKDSQKVRKRYRQGQLRVGFNLYPFELNGECKMDERNLKSYKCAICKREFYGIGNNPDPVVKDEIARCCNRCNEEIVIPARIEQLKGV